MRKQRTFLLEKLVKAFSFFFPRQIVPQQRGQNPIKRVIQWFHSLILPQGGIQGDWRARNASVLNSAILVPVLSQCGFPNESKSLNQWLAARQNENGGFIDQQYSLPEGCTTCLVRHFLELDPWVSENSQHIIERIRQAELTLHSFCPDKLNHGSAKGFFLLPCSKVKVFSSRFKRKIRRPQRAGSLLLSCVLKSVVDSLSDPRSGSFLRCSHQALSLLSIDQYLAADLLMKGLDKVILDFPLPWNLSNSPNPDFIETFWGCLNYFFSHRKRVLLFMGELENVFPGEIESSDERFQEIVKYIQPSYKIADIGCGKGRFLKQLLSIFPNLNCTGVDISKRLLSHLPESCMQIEGSLERIPLPSDKFDLVFAVESIEHSLNYRAAISEMVRILKPNGRFIIIDKNTESWGMFNCPSWEEWPSTEDILGSCIGLCHPKSFVSKFLFSADGVRFHFWTGIKSDVA